MWHIFFFQKLHKEIYFYQDLALRHKKEVREIERQVKESRVKAEETRSGTVPWVQHVRLLYHVLYRSVQIPVSKNRKQFLF